MGKPIKRNAKNVHLMNPAQKKAYKRHLALVRKYTRLKREWEKKRKLEIIPLTVTFQEYQQSRGLTKSVEQLDTESKAIKNKPPTDRLETLMRELRRTRDREAQLKQELLKLLG